MPSSRSKSSSNNGDAGCCDAFDLENICTSGHRSDEDSVVEDYDYVRAHKSDSQWMAEARAKVQAMIRTNYLTALGMGAAPSAMSSNYPNSGDEESNAAVANTTREYVDDVQKDTAAYDTDDSSTKIGASILMISGCEDAQTSADVQNVSNFSLPDPNGKAG